MIKKLLARLLPPKNHFHGGLHITPPRHKSMSTGTPSREAALSAEYAISLRQRDGSAYLAKVAPGERVLRGQLLAEPVNTQDAPVHAPTSGTIRAIESRPEMHPSNLPVPHLILDSDGKDESVPPLPALDIETASADELRERIAACGIVGLGGAGFPTARKLGHPANTLVINAAECEPYITCDDLQIRENAADIIHGAQIAAKILGAEHIHFGIEDDKPQAIAALERAAADINDPRLKISSVPTRYPSGNARQLFELLLGVRVPADQHASDYGLICHNSGTMKAVYDAVIRGEPLTERYTTISGEGVNQPQVLRIRTGAPVRDLIAQAGGEKGDNRYIIGGPMMGYQIISADTPLQKTGNSLLLLPAIAPAEESPCIRCSRCADACPMELLPQQLLWYSQSDEHKRLKQYRLYDCIECGICAAVCPSAIPLVQYYRHSKGAIRAADDKTRAAEHARTRHEARTARLEREAAERQAQMDARRAKLQQNPAADKPERYTPAKPAVAASPTMMPPPPVEGSRQSSAASDDKTAAIEAAKARAAARRAERLAAQNSEAKTPANLPPSPCGGGDGGGVRPHTADANTATDVGRPFMADNNIGHECPTYNPVTTVPAPHQLPSDPGKTAAIEAAKARAAARRAERLAAQNEKAETSTAPASRTEVLPPSQDAPASAAGEGWGGGSALHSGTNTETSTNTAPAPHQLPPDPGKTAAIEAAKARAAARRAERLAAQNNEATTPTAPTSPTELPPPSQDALASAAGEGWGGGSDLHFGTNVETSTNVDPAPHQLPPDSGKIAAIEAAKARAAARKAARLAQQPLNQETSVQHPLTPPHPSPTGGGSLSVAASPAVAESPAALPPSPRGGGDGGGVRPHTADAEISADLPPPPQRSAAGEGWGGGSALHSGTNAETSADVDPAPHQLPPDPGKTAAIEAAKARAAARRAERLATQNNEAKTPFNLPTSPRGGGDGGGVRLHTADAETSTELLPPPQRSAAGEGWGGGTALHSSTNTETSTNVEPAPHQLPPDPGKTAAIEAAKARAAARKAARLAQQPLNEDAAAQHPQTPPHPSPTGGGSLSVAEPPTDAETSTELLPPPQRSAAGEGGGGGNVPDFSANIETTTDTAPAPHQLPPDDAKTAAIEVAKARAAARKAARLAQQPLNEEASAQNPPTPPHPSPAGGGSASMAEPPTGQPITLPQTEEQAETSMTPPDNDDKTARDAKLAAARAKSEERRIAHAKLKQHMRDTAIPIRPQPDDPT